MEESDIVKVVNADAPSITADFRSDWFSENLPAEKRTELAFVAQNRRLELSEDVARRTIRLQSSSIDMDETLRKADELSRIKGDFIIRSSHDTASGRTEITVRSHSPFIYVILGIGGLILLAWIMR
jgi:hypothetical protein